MDNEDKMKDNKKGERNEDQMEDNKTHPLEQTDPTH